MKGEKKKEYRLEVNAYDTITTSIVISEKTYKEKLKDLQQQVASTQDDIEGEFKAKEETKVYEFPKYTRTIHHINLNMVDINLIAVVCKDGYCFK